MSDMLRFSKIRIIAGICLRRWPGVGRICLTFGCCRSIEPPVLLFRRLRTKCVGPRSEKLISSPGSLCLVYNAVVSLRAALVLVPFQRLDAFTSDEPFMGSVSAIAEATFVLATLSERPRDGLPRSTIPNVVATCCRERSSSASDRSRGQSNPSIQAGTGKSLDQARPILGADETRCCSDPVP